MLTDAEILDNQTQTLEEVLDKLHSRSDEPLEKAVAVDVGNDALHVAVECLRTLSDLHRTIAVEGVSKDDVSALRAIQARMQPYIRLPSKVALEAYEGLFTPNRTMINQTISQEATLAEFGKTLKEWFFIFVDFIIRVSDWCRRVWNSEDAIRLRLKNMDSNLQSMYNQVNELIKYNAKFGRDAEPDLLKISELVLADPKLTRSNAMLIAFNVPAKDGIIKVMDRDADRLFNSMMKDLVSFKLHIEQNKPIGYLIDYGKEFTEIASCLEALTVAVDDQDFFKDNLSLDFWKNPKQLVSRQIFAPSHNIDQVQRLAKEIRSIKRNSNFDALEDADVLATVIENLSEAVKGLERIIKFKQQLYADCYKVSATYANFYIRARDHIEETLRANVADDIEAKVMERLTKAWEELLKRMGV
ncbi:virion structural protein [Pseudomonas phage 201phi2-1]|uniref:Virion structural protein n=1 Tax=Pseudomonas phage 201phi2-1 TaxID=198110 RepID=B3FJ11_BP201|nr:virion structural protein [Pseudomonas phage 201phi2-1]ABY62978.1 virion structural protein [Pseudomonas phage 201phi2-1]